MTDSGSAPQVEAKTTQQDEELQRIREILFAAMEMKEESLARCDRSALELAMIASNAIFWRNREIQNLRAAAGVTPTPATQWVSVEERLPAPNSSVLFWTHNGSWESGYFRADDDEAIRWECERTGPQDERIDFFEGEVTHWMIPDPPLAAAPGSTSVTDAQWERNIHEQLDALGAPRSDMNGNAFSINGRFAYLRQTSGSTSVAGQGTPTKCPTCGSLFRGSSPCINPDHAEQGDHWSGESPTCVSCTDDWHDGVSESQPAKRREK